MRVLELDDGQAARYALWENLAREEMNPMELAERVDAQRRIEGATWTDISAQFGLTRQSGHRLKTLLELPPSVRALVRDGRLEATKAERLARVKGEPDKLQELARRVVEEGLSDRDIERILKDENVNEG